MEAYDSFYNWNEPDFFDSEYETKGAGDLFRKAYSAIVTAGQWFTDTVLGAPPKLEGDVDIYFLPSYGNDEHVLYHSALDTLPTIRESIVTSTVRLGDDYNERLFKALGSTDSVNLHYGNFVNETRDEYEDLLAFEKRHHTFWSTFDFAASWVWTPATLGVGLPIAYAAMFRSVDHVAAIKSISHLQKETYLVPDNVIDSIEKAILEAPSKKEAFAKAAEIAYENGYDDIGSVYEEGRINDFKLSKHYLTKLMDYFTIEEEEDTDGELSIFTPSFS